MSTVPSSEGTLRRPVFDCPRHAPTVALVPFAGYTAAVVAYNYRTRGRCRHRGRMSG